jgi:hypothetical protein
MLACRLHGATVGAAPVAARLMAAELGWNAAREAAEVAAFQMESGIVLPGGAGKAAEV